MHPADTVHPEEAARVENAADTVEHQEPKPVEDSLQEDITSNRSSSHDGNEGALGEESDQTLADAIEQVSDPELTDRAKNAALAKSERRARLKAARNMRFGMEEALEEEEQEESEHSGVDSVRFSTSSKREHSSFQSSSISEPSTLNVSENIRLLSNVSDDESDIVQPPVKGDTIGQKNAFLELFEVPGFSDISEAEPDERPRRVNSSILQQPYERPLKSRIGLSSMRFSLASNITINSDDLALNHFEAMQSGTENSSSSEMDIFERFSRDPERAEVLRPSQIKANRKETCEVVQTFLDTLINDVITNYEEDKKIQRAKDIFNKEKLYMALIDLLVKKQRNIFLNSKMVEYIKRVKNYRMFKELSPEQNAKELLRLRTALQEYDHKLKVIAEAKRQNSYLMTSVLMDLWHVEQLCYHVEEHLEAFIRQTIGSRSEHLAKCVERELEHMRHVRYEISDVRLPLITRKNTLGSLREKIRKFERIDDQLQMDDFINMQNRVAALDKKREERSQELEKMYQQYITELHIANHMRENRLAMNHKLEICKSRLVQVLMKQSDLRETLYRGKLERNRLRKQHAELIYNGGLLDLPNLMHDYDNTVDRVEAKQANINEMKEQVKRLTERLAQWEARCNQD
ncbi:hypothetical protein KR222_008251 [Zaprionus bogoriensis]|nr:hypothetical protein KR222_008251 [Zaprionus bogoriensis]